MAHPELFEKIAKTKQFYVKPAVLANDDLTGLRVRYAFKDETHDTLQHGAHSNELHDSDVSILHLFICRNSYCMSVMGSN